MGIHNTDQPPVITPPRWKIFAVMAAICLLCLRFWIDNIVYQGISWEWIATLITALFVVSKMITSGIHYKFTEDHLTVCFLWIPLRRIRWQRITNALFAHAWSDPKTKYQHIMNPGAVTGQIIYVTIDHCPEWYPVLSMRWTHNSIHPFRAFTVWLPYKQNEYYINAFKKHYPNLEMQPLDEWKYFS